VFVLLPILKQLVGREISLRMNFQSGSLVEVVRDLESFGLTMEHIMAVFSNEIYHRTQAKKWMTKSL
jgi:hypothetical protein